MPKKLIKRFMPDHHSIRNHKYLRFFGRRLHDPSLWHLNRRSASGAFAVGLFAAFVPMPLQMILAAAGAIFARVNLPVSVALVWLTNPITMPPIYYATYRFGLWLMGIPSPDHGFEFSIEWFTREIDSVWLPFLIGSFAFGTICALLGYFAVRGLWRLNVVRHWKRKKKERQKREIAPQD
jgi:uncharacterized protein (DUF2062 family)